MSLRRVVRVAIALVADRSPVVRHQLCGQVLGRLCGLGRQVRGRHAARGPRRPWEHQGGSA